MAGWADVFQTAIRGGIELGGRYLLDRMSNRAERDRLKIKAKYGGSPYEGYGLPYSYEGYAPQVPSFGAMPLTSLPFTGGAPMQPIYAPPPYVQTGGLDVLQRGIEAYRYAAGATPALPAMAGVGGAGGIIDAPAVWTQTMGGGVRARRFFATVNPATGNLAWFRSAGRPILWSGDLGACKRVNRIAARARRAGGRRGFAPRRKGK